MIPCCDPTPFVGLQNRAFISPYTSSCPLYMFFSIVLHRRHICIWEVVSAERLNHLSPTEKTTRMNNWVQMSLIWAWYQGSFPVCALWNNPHLPDSKHLPPIGAAQVSAEESNKRTRETFLLAGWACQMRGLYATISQFPRSTSRMQTYIQPQMWALCGRKPSSL